VRDGAAGGWAAGGGSGGVGGVRGLAVGAAAHGAARADDWPQWLGPQRDGVWRETGLLDKFPAAGPKVLWRVPVGKGYTGPAVVGDRVYVMDRAPPPAPPEAPKGSKEPKERKDARPDKAGRRG